MTLILLEALGALLVLLAIVWWTMFSGRKNGELEGDLSAAPAEPEPAPDMVPESPPASPAPAAASGKDAASR